MLHFAMMRRRLLSGLLILLACAAPAAGQARDVQVTLDQFGVGSAMRPGDYAAVRLELLSRLDTAATVWVQWEKTNADGDIAEHGRSITLTPGQPLKTWLYAPLSEDDDPGRVWSIKVFEFADGVKGGEIGGARISPSQAGAQAVDISTSLIAVIGNNRLGLSDYTVAGMRGRSVSAHEETRIISGIRTEDLPDRWFALRGFEAIAWGADVPPAGVTLDQADALRDYIRRGGHLVIVLPAQGTPWSLGASGQNLFEDLLPPRAPARHEDVPLSDTLAILSKSAGAATDFPMSLSVFGRIGAPAGDPEHLDPPRNGYYEPLVVLPDGRIVVVQRTFGHGRITICGIDISSARLTSMGLPHADVLWNRILGRRQDTPSASELQAIDQDGRLARSVPSSNNLGSGNLFAQFTQHEQSASVGILLAFVLFVGYWLVAGPGGFYALKHYRQVKHSWLAFAATAGLFTALAWGAVAAIRPKTIVVRHVTILDHIARKVGDGSHNPDRGDNDPQLQRAILYGSILLPSYGRVPVTLDDSARHNLLESWDPPGVAEAPFPNPARYGVDVSARINALDLPARSTTTRIRAEWIGGVSDSWGGMLSEDPLDPITVTIDPAGAEQISGSILSNLPGPLTNVTVFWIKNQRVRPRRYQSSGDVEQPWVNPVSSGQMLNIGNHWKVAGAVAPGGSISLAVPAGSILSLSIDNTYSDRFKSSGFPGVPSGSRAIGPDDRRWYMEMLSIFQQLAPPRYLVAPNTQGDQQTPSFYREVARELDLSTWFTRPCLIVIGWLENTPTPIPLEADGRPVASDGLTLVRWICPLPLNDEIAFRNVMETDGKSDE